jgi:Domain of unknown function (DUF1772)
MFSISIEFLSLLLAALVVGAMFCVWLIFNPDGLPFSFYIALQQRGVRTLHPAMPVLGGATILTTLLAAITKRADHLRLELLLAAACCFVAAGLITRFLNQPINAIMMTWNSSTPPDGWTNLRDAWWRWHQIRLATGLLGFVLLAAVALSRT